MTRKRTFPPANFPVLACLALGAIWSASGVCPAHGQVAVTPVIEPSPMIARGHLQGGINGEGNIRPDRKTPLMLAVDASDLKVLAYLLQHGADPELKDAAGETAFDLARKHASPETADLLIAYQSTHPGMAEYYAGSIPVLSAVSAKSQSGSPGCAAAHPLVVAVTDQAGQPLADAPVRFVVDGGSKHLLTQASSPDSPSLLLRTDGSGQCRATVHLLAEPNASIHVVATANSGEQVSTVTFTALTNDGTGGDSASGYAPNDIQADSSPTGELDLSWQNNTDDETAIKVWLKLPEGWKVVATVPPHTTSAHIPRQ